MQNNLNSKEQLALEKFRSLSLKYNLEDSSDHFLLRWLKARKFDVKNSEEMLKKCVEWRKSNQVDDFVNWIPPRPIKDDFNYRFTGYDAEGRPVLIVPCGRWHVRKMIEQGLKQECIKAVHKILEEVTIQIKRSSAKEFVAILDIEEQYFQKVAHFETLDAMLKFFRDFEEYYPEMLHQAYLINTPWAFGQVFTLLKPLLSSRTLGKLHIYASESQWRPILNEIFPKETLPINYGGFASKFF